jgi:hypothetical protein
MGLDILKTLMTGGGNGTGESSFILRALEDELYKVVSSAALRQGPTEKWYAEMRDLGYSQEVASELWRSVVADVLARDRV